MTTINYSKSKLQKTAFGCPVLAFGGIMVLGELSLFMMVVMVIGILCLFAVAFQAGQKLAGDRTALRYDRQQLTLVTMWSQRTIFWRDVASVSTSSFDTYGLYGLIKVSSTGYLNIKMKGGLFAKKHRLLSDMLDLTKIDLALLIDDLRRHADLAAGVVVVPTPLGPGVAQRDSAVTSAQQNPDAFDADGAIARYLHGRDGSGATPEPTAQPAAPPMPSFGRRRDPLEGGQRGDLSIPASAGFGRKQQM